MTKRPAIKTPCVADQYAGPGERIAEVTFSDGTGCLISVRELGKIIEIYNADPGITVRAGDMEAETKGDKHEQS